MDLPALSKLTITLVTLGSSLGSTCGLNVNWHQCLAFIVLFIEYYMVIFRNMAAKMHICVRLVLKGIVCKLIVLYFVSC